MAADPFKKAEDEYFRLKGQLATGRITPQEFEDALKGLMFQDAQGRWWMLGADSGKWYVHDGVRWNEAAPSTSSAGVKPPPQTEAAPPQIPMPARAARRNSFGPLLVVGAVVVVLALVLVVAAVGVCLRRGR
jgi:hypothetical protein